MQPTVTDAAPTRRSRYATAVAAVLAFAPVVHVVVRALSELRRPEADPRALIWTERSVLVGRAAVTGYLTVALATLAVPWLSRRTALAERAFEVGVASSLLVALAAEALR